MVLQDINAYRKSKGIPEAAKDPKTCQYADQRSKELLTDFSHAGFTKTAKQFYGTGFITENLAMNYTYEEVVREWSMSPTHNKMLLADTPYICVAKEGRYWAMEGWKP
jgi:uncharacterized protein YkwD